MIGLASNAQGRRLVWLMLSKSLGDEKATLWLNSHNYHLAGVPAELMKTTYGLRQVVDYLRAMKDRGGL